MTHAVKHARNLPAAALAALLLAGCSSGHVGESWQCPLADAGTCGSVADADPAVPRAARNALLAEPPHRARGGSRPKAPGEAPRDADCGGGLDPFGWLARLFGAETADGKKMAGPALIAPPEAPAAAALPADPEAAEADAGGGTAIGGGLRTDEVVARIWIAPFVDADGVYREAAWVRAVLEPARWRLGR